MRLGEREAVAHGKIAGGAVKANLAQVALRVRVLAVGSGHIHVEDGRVSVVGKGEIARGVLPSGALIAAAEDDRVMAAALHRPDVVALGAEGLAAVGFHAHVAEHRLAVGVQDVITDVVMVVALAVVAALRGEVQPRAVGMLARAGNLNAVEGVGERLVDRGKRFARMAIGKQVAQAAILRVPDQLIGRGGEPRCQRVFGIALQIGKPHALGGAMEQHRVGRDERRRVGEIYVIAAVNVHIQDVACHVLNQRLVVDRYRAAAGQIEQLQRVQHGSARDVEVARAFVAAAVRRVTVQEAIETAGDACEQRVPALGRGFLQERAQQHVRVDPRVPVVHGAVARKAHPEKVAPLQIGRQDAALDFQRRAPGDDGGGLVQFFTEQVADHRQKRAGLSREQVDVRRLILHVRQREGRDVPRGSGVVVVRRDDPAAFLADCPHEVDDVVQAAAAVFQTFAHREREQRAAALKIRLFIVTAIAHAHELHIQGGGQRRNGLSDIRLRRARVVGARFGIDRVPRRAVMAGGQQMEALAGGDFAVLQGAGNDLVQHGASSVSLFSGCSRLKSRGRDSGTQNRP